MGPIHILYRYVRHVQVPLAPLDLESWRNRSCVLEMFDELEWPSLEARSISFPCLFYKIHCGAVSIEKDKKICMTPAHSSKTTRSSIVLNIEDTRHTVMP